MALRRDYSEAWLLRSRPSIEHLCARKRSSQRHRTTFGLYWSARKLKATRLLELGFSFPAIARRAREIEARMEQHQEPEQKVSRISMPSIPSLRGAPERLSSPGGLRISSAPFHSLKPSLTAPHTNPSVIDWI